jgi:hypothetical protein
MPTTRQTCISLTDDRYLVFNYMRTMMGALYVNPSPSRILIVGLGGGAIAGALQKMLPTAKIDAVEIDPAVVRVARTYFGFVPTQQTDIYEEDGRVFAKRMLKQGVKYDLVILDAFDHQYIPEHLLTREFLLEVRGLLTPRGVVTTNTYASTRLYDHESATYHSVFGNFYSLVTNNRVIIATVAGCPTRTSCGATPRSSRPGCARSEPARTRCCRCSRSSPAGRQHADPHRPVLAVEPAERDVASAQRRRPHGHAGRPRQSVNGRNRLTSTSTFGQPLPLRGAGGRRRGGRLPMRIERRVVDVGFVEQEEVGIVLRTVQPVREAAGLGLAHDADLLGQQRGECIALALRRPDLRHHGHLAGHCPSALKKGVRLTNPERVSRHMAAERR